MNRDLESAKDDLRFKVPDRTYWKDQIKCQAACPVHTDARGYVRAIADEDYELAYLIARSPNPLASICGRVCGAPCELSCRRKDIDQAISIRVLKRFICEKFGPEARAAGGKGLIDDLKQAAAHHTNRPCRDQDDLLELLQSLLSKDLPLVKDKSVGIVGAGPAGLTAAHDLALLGFAVTIYEMESVLGGMVALGIPEYRLPRDIIQAEAEVISSMGVEMVTECCVGKDISLAELRAKHDAVVIAVGAKCSRDARFPGADASGVLGGVEFLRSVSLGQIPEMGQRVVVVGGGDSAMDSARSALRIKAEEEDADQYFAVDAARSASLFGARDVTIVYRRSRTEMPAIETEIIEAEEEGIKFHLLTSPLRIEKDEQGKVKGVWCEKMELGEADSSGRRKPVPVDGSDHFIECDNVILAIGQTFDLSFVDPAADGLEMTDWGTLKCDPQLGTTTAPDVYVAGDLAYGPKLVIHAVASGKQIARTIYGDLTGRSITYNETELHLAGLGYERETDYEHQTRVPIDTMDVQDRPQSQKVMTEKNYTTPQAGCEAGRCLDCGVNTIFDGESCILCGGCVDVCPELCLRIVSADLLDADDTQTNMISQHLDDMAPERASAILKDETLCIRCGLCAERCPTGAITMERFMFREIPLCRND